MCSFLFAAPSQPENVRYFVEHGQGDPLQVVSCLNCPRFSLSVALAFSRIFLDEEKSISNTSLQFFNFDNSSHTEVFGRSNVVSITR